MASARIHPSAVSVFVIQLAVLLTLSIVQWHRYALSFDFGVYGQAIWLIGHGHLAPWDSLQGISFLRNNGELIIWPIGLVGALFGQSPFVLLVIQDLAIALAGLVGLLWISEILDRYLDPGSFAHRWLWLAGLATVAVDPWCFQTALFDFHNEALAGLFTLLAVRELWRGGRCWPYVVSVIVICTTGTAGVLEAIGLGLSVLFAPKRQWRFALVVIAASTVWLAVLVIFGLAGQNGANVTGNLGFGYLDPTSRHPSIAGLILGMFTHLPAIAHVVAPKITTALLLLLPVGLIGFIHRLAIGPALAVFGPAMLAHSTLFFRPPAAYQVWPVLLLVLACSVELLARSGQPSNKVAMVSPVVLRYLPLHSWTPYATAAWVTGLASISSTVLGSLPANWLAVTPAAATSISQIASLIPPDAEVIATQGIVGRFATRHQVFGLMSTQEQFPIKARTVVFVLAPLQGALEIEPGATETIIAWARRLPGRDLLVSTPQVTAISWTPPRGTSSITIAGDRSSPKSSNAN